MSAVYGLTVGLAGLVVPGCGTFGGTTGLVGSAGSVALAGSLIDVGLVGSGVLAGVVAGSLGFLAGSAFSPLSFSDESDDAPESLPYDVPPLGRDAVTPEVLPEGSPAVTRPPASSLEPDELWNGLG